MKNEYGNYKCRNCGTRKRAWKESLCYQEKLCPKCYDAKENEKKLNRTEG